MVRSIGGGGCLGARLGEGGGGRKRFLLDW